MNEQEIIKAIAELDGWTNIPMFGGSGFWYQNFSELTRDSAEHGTLKGAHAEYQLPPYLTSRDAIVPVIEKQEYNIQLRFARALAKICDADRWHEKENYAMQILKSIPCQLCEALLRATGRWKD